MKLKMKEYDELKRDIENDLSDNKKRNNSQFCEINNENFSN